MRPTRVSDVAGGVVYVTQGRREKPAERKVMVECVRVRRILDGN